VLTVRQVEIEYWAGENGTFTADGEVWATTHALSVILALDDNTIESRNAGCRKREGKDLMGKGRTFYSVTDITKACQDLLEDLPRSDPNGFVKPGGRTYGTVHAVSKLLGLSFNAVDSRITPDIPKIQAYTLGGFKAEFYLVSSLKKACRSLLTRLPVAGLEGSFESDGEEWYTRKSLARKLGASPETIDKNRKQIRTRKGLYRGQRCTFYCAKDVLASLGRTGLDKAKLPKAGRDGLFFAQKEWWGPMKTLAGILGVTFHTLDVRMGTGKRSKKGTALNGKVVDFFCYSDAEEACADLLEKKKKRKYQTRI